MGGECGREGGGQDGVEWGGKWDNCNSIINKYIKKKKKISQKPQLRESLFSTTSELSLAKVDILKQQKILTFLLP